MRLFNGDLFRSVRFRTWLVQALALALLLSAAAWGVGNVARNLRKAGVATGFGFLAEPSGFDVGMTLIEYDSRHTYARALLVGTLNTVLVSGMSIVCATLLGFFLGVIRLSPNWLVSRMAAAYTEIVRNVPLLLQILFWYLAVLSPLPGPRGAIPFFNAAFLCNRGLQIPRPMWEPGFAAVPAALAAALILSALLLRWNRKRQAATGERFPAGAASAGLLLALPLAALILTDFPIHWDIPALQGFNFEGGVTVLPELIALWLALTLYAAAFIAEYVRAGLLSVDRGQQEAARALGHRPWMTWRLVVIPQAMRVVTPPLIGQYLAVVKNSSLAVVIGYPDLVHVFSGTALNQSGQAVEIISITMGVYLLVSLTISLFMNWYNRKFALRGQ